MTAAAASQTLLISAPQDRSPPAPLSLRLRRACEDCPLNFAQPAGSDAAALLRQLSPMKAAASAAASASSIPASGAIPSAMRAAARSSGMFSDERRDNRRARTGLSRRCRKRARRGVPVGAIAAIIARKIEYQQRQIEAASHHRGESVVIAASSVQTKVW